MDRRQRILGPSMHHAGMFVVTCALHAAAIYYAADLVAADRDILWSTLQVSFISNEKPTEPPAPPPIPVLLDDAFAEHYLREIPPPAVEIPAPVTARRVIHAPVPPSPPLPDAAPQEDQGYGPLTRPRVLSGPHSSDRYPRQSIRHKESGRTVVKICISTTGSVESVEVAESSGYPNLDRAAVDIGWDYVFAPALREGKPVRVCLPYGIRFRIAVGGGLRRRP